jgi:hypothetical protein
MMTGHASRCAVAGGRAYERAACEAGEHRELFPFTSRQRGERHRAAAQRPSHDLEGQGIDLDVDLGPVEDPGVRIDLLAEGPDVRLMRLLAFLAQDRVETLDRGCPRVLRVDVALHVLDLRTCLRKPVGEPLVPFELEMLAGLCALDLVGAGVRENPLLQLLGVLEHCARGLRVARCELPLSRLALVGCVGDPRGNRFDSLLQLVVGGDATMLFQFAGGALRFRAGAIETRRLFDASVFENAQRALAREAKVTDAHLSRLLRGIGYRTKPSANLAHRVALALALPPDYFREYREAIVIEHVKNNPKLREELYDRLTKRKH